MTTDIRSYATVERWMANVNRYYQLPESEWVERLEALRVYCERLGKTPDQVVQEAVDVKGAKVDFMRELRRISREVKADAREAHDWDGIVRSFFIHNGARVVVRPYAEE